jgi:alkanesulfonate monooxygenase SsuD/methylene tetrahydromethanopterin reductase-like flavin-dependent oxidoreductase (luciferase family)
MVRIGVAIPQLLDDSHGVEGLVPWLMAAEESGFDGAWVLDSTIGGPSAHRPLADGLVLLGFAAALTSRLRLGAAVIVLPHRLPLLLAKEVATLDRLSRGRIVLGVGVGGRDAVTGLPGLDRLGPRAAVAEQGIALLRAAWRRHEPSTTASLRIEPSPVQAGGPPIWIGATSTPAIERAVRLGDGWVGSGSTGMHELEAQLTALTRALASHDPARGSFAIAKRVRIAIDPGSPAHSRAGLIAGTVRECAEQIRRLAELGLTDLILEPIDGSVDQLSAMAEVANRVMGP